MSSPYLPLPFSVAWRKELETAMRQGGWHVHAADSQHGKSTANRQFFLDMTPRSGLRAAPVALAWATDNRLITRSIAESIGGRLFAQQRHIELRVPDLMKRLGTKLVIVNNGHNMDWRQWNELLTLDDICWTQHGIQVGVVLSGVHKELGLTNLPKDPSLIQQITARVTCYKHIPGHDRGDVRVALKVLLERDCPKLLERDVLAQSGLVYELLTRPEIDPARTKRVSARDLAELVRRMAAVQQSNPRSSCESIVQQAFRHYLLNRTPPRAQASNPTAALAVAVAAPAAQP